MAFIMNTHTRNHGDYTALCILAYSKYLCMQNVTAEKKYSQYLLKYNNKKK